jgi:hypothetical protein
LGHRNQRISRYVYTSEFEATYTQRPMPASPNGVAGDGNGGNDSLMLSTMNTDVQVHLGRHGWIIHRLQGADVAGHAD